MLNPTMSMGLVLGEVRKHVLIQLLCELRQANFPIVRDEVQGVNRQPVAF
jgi:hypothetical protein